MKQTMKKAVTFAVMGAMALNLTAFKANTTGMASKKEPVTLRIATYWVGTLPEAAFMKKLVEEFPKSKLGEGVKIELEEIPGADAYAQKMKLLISAGDLPDIIQATGANYLDLAVKSGKVADLTSYFNKDKQWKGLFDQKSLDYNTRNKKIYAVPYTKEVCTMFYNKELFKKAGIAKFPQTWDEFFQVCGKLKAAKITPIAMDSAEYGWFTSLMLCSMIGTNGKSGNAWMNTRFPKNYNTPEVISALANIQKLFKEYTTKDAVGGNWVVPTNHFEKGEAAMIPNGPWMVPDFKDTTKVDAGFYDNIEVAAFPGNGIISVPQFGEMIGAKDPAKIQAAVNFEKFKTSVENQIAYMKITGNIYESPKIAAPKALIKENPLLGKIIDIAGKTKVTYGENQALWYPNTLDALSNLLPDLAFGKLSPEAMAKRLTDVAQRNK